MCGKQEIHAQQVKYLDTRLVDWNKLMVIRLCSIGLCNGPQSEEAEEVTAATVHVVQID